VTLPSCTNKKNQRFSLAFVLMRSGSHQPNNPTRARITAENAGETACLEKGDAESDVTQCQGVPNWAEVRELILACEELSADVRQSLIVLGDAERVT